MNKLLGFSIYKTALGIFLPNSANLCDLCVI